MSITIRTLPFAFFCGIFLLGFTASAQVSGQAEKAYSDEELRSFMAVTEKMQEIQSQLQGEIQEMLDEEGLELAQFQAMSKAQMKDPGNADLQSYSEAEKASFQKVLQAVMRKQKEQMSVVQELIDSKGLDMLQFQQMAQAVQTDPELAERLAVLRREE